MTRPTTADKTELRVARAFTKRVYGSALAAGAVRPGRPLNGRRACNPIADTDDSTAGSNGFATS